jgi:DNA-binding transcriptional ArsR family regulator
MTELGRFKAEFFKALAHPMRIAVLDALRDGELGVNELCVYYSVRDVTVFKLLDVAKQIFNNHLIGVQDMLAQLEVRAGGRR